MPDQEFLLKCLNSDSEPKYLAFAVAETRRLGGIARMDKVFAKYNIDIIVVLRDSALCRIAAAFGYPIAVAAMDVLGSFEICLVAPARKENRFWHSCEPGRVHWGTDRYPYCL
jgi:hypothetical protein